MPYLIIKRPGLADQREFLPEGDVIVGRTEENNIMIDEPSVSRRHASISPEPAGYRIRDLGSTNGTRVNGKKLDAEGYLLKNCDRIALGGNQVAFSYYTGDETVTGTDTISRWGVGLPWQMQFPSSRWRFLVWLRGVGIVLGVISGTLGILFWLLKILNS